MRALALRNLTALTPDQIIATREKLPAALPRWLVEAGVVCMNSTAKIYHEPVDARGIDLKVGDCVWVRVIAAPLSVISMPLETKSAFSRAVGSTFRVEGFGADGSVELDLFPKISLDTIWLEPYRCVRFRRYRGLPGIKSSR